MSDLVATVLAKAMSILVEKLFEEIITTMIVSRLTRGAAVPAG